MKKLCLYTMLAMTLIVAVACLVRADATLERCESIYKEVNSLSVRVDELRQLLEQAKLERSAPMPHGEPLSCGVLDDCVVTYYCCEQYPHICNAGPPYTTATGKPLVAYRTCAVDPSIIPLGSEVTVLFEDGSYSTYIAHDTGGAIKGGRIDIAVATHDEAMSLGRDVAKIYWRESTDA